MTRADPAGVAADILANTPEGPPVVAPGTVLAPGYVALRLLSRGHRLDVYDAWSEGRRCRCVVKIARPDRAGEPGVRRQLLEEGALLRRLDHPHWVRLYDVIDGERAALILETLPGATLSAVLDDRRRLCADDAMVLGAQLASALGYLHDRGWLHLDLTPGNVVVTGGMARVIDLSLARRPGPSRRGAGTAGYRSPEQVAGDPVGSATDVWGLGLLLHEALSGREPGATRRRSDGLPPLRRRQGVRRLPSTLVDLVNECLTPDPRRRPRLDAVLQRLSGAHAPTAQSAPC